MAREIYGQLRQEQQLRLALFLAKDKVNSAAGVTMIRRSSVSFRKLEELIRLRKRWSLDYRAALRRHGVPHLPERYAGKNTAASLT